MKDNLDEFLKSATGLQLAYDTLKKSLPTIEKEKKELDNVIEAGIKELKNKITNVMLEIDKQYQKYNKELKVKEKNLLAILDSTKQELDKITEKETNTQKLYEKIKQERINTEKMLEDIKKHITQQIEIDIKEIGSAKYFYQKYKDTGIPVILTKYGWTNQFCFWLEEINEEQQKVIGTTYKNGKMYRRNETYTYLDHFKMAPQEWVNNIIKNE